MKPNRAVYLVNAYISSFLGKGHPRYNLEGNNPTLENYISEAIQGLFEKQPYDPGVVQRGYIGNFGGELFCNQGHLGAMASRADNRLSGVPFTRVEAACASGGVALACAVDAIQAGMDITVALGAEVQNTVRARQCADYLARASHYATEREIDDFTFPALMARRAKACKENYHLTDMDLARVSLKAYENANCNPLAQMYALSLDLEQAATASEVNPNFLSNEKVKDHMKISDCSQVTDGSASVLLCSEEGIEKLGLDKRDCVRIRSYGYRTEPLGQVDDLLALTNVRATVQEALADAEMRPDDLDVAEVHDCFTIAEVLMYEAIGWAEPGKGAHLLREGHTLRSGSMPVNTGGGLIGFGHPVGATGVKQAAEIWRQMKGKCGDYQLATIPRTGLTVNMGGDDRTVVSFVLENVA